MIAMLGVVHHADALLGGDGGTEGGGVRIFQHEPQLDRAFTFRWNEQQGIGIADGVVENDGVFGSGIGGDEGDLGQEHIGQKGRQQHAQHNQDR
jgi:hypothetical protein